MNLRKLVGDARAASNVLLIVLIALLMLSASSVVILAVQGNQSAQSNPSKTAQVGDTVSVNYIGKLADGRVFDTSFYDVATNNALYPKSLAFDLRPQANYTPLSFTVGAGQMISGFDTGVVGMTVGATKVLVIPSNKAYGDPSASLMVSFGITEEIPVFETINNTIFQERYNTTAVQGMTVTDLTWGWDVNVLQVNTPSDMILIQNMPTTGQILTVFGHPDATSPTGWHVLVVSIDTAANHGNGAIKIQHQITAADDGKIKGIDRNGNTFILDRVDLTGGTAVMDYNSELRGKTLYFTVTLVSVTKKA
jgi:FKBP-type peptidyl-prolyl cis-trans isomerase 2